VSVRELHDGANQYKHDDERATHAVTVCLAFTCTSDRKRVGPGDLAVARRLDDRGKIRKPLEDEAKNF
jgi:hypothetical protein